jgi:site-specific DNA-methyltransferase (adenine-specific)
MTEVHLLQGDCLEIMRGMPTASVDAVVTDPPYSSGGQFRGDRTASPSLKYIQTDSVDTFRMPFSGDNRDQRGFLVWCSMWLGEARRICKPGGLVACFTDWRQLPTLTDAMQCGGWIWRGIATWWKPGIRMQRGRFSLSAEYVVFGTNGEWAEGEKSPQNVFSCAPVSGNDKEHIAEKPISVLNWIVGVTPAGAKVFDPFVGSGTTGISCVQLGRDFIGCEIDPISYQTAERRITDAQMQIVMPL